jgi:hypothetical protein
MSKQYRFGFERKEMGVEYRDAGPWRHYELSTYGDNVEQMIDNAEVSSVDQDGGDIGNSKPLSDTSREIEACGEEMIRDFVEREVRERNEAAKDYAINREIAEKRGK